MKIGITSLELHEYFQNGCIRVKDYIMNSSHSGTYVYYGHEAGYKQYRNINFEEEFYFYRMRANHNIHFDLQSSLYMSPDYGLVFIENFHENYLLELKEKEHIASLVCLSKKRGYKTEVIGEREFVCIWKNLKR